MACYGGPPAPLTSYITTKWDYTNKVWVQLEKGAHQLSLTFEPANENMNGEINQAMIDHLRIIRVQ